MCVLFDHACCRVTGQRRCRLYINKVVGMAVTKQDFMQVASAAAARDKAATDKQKSYIDRFFSTVLPKNPKAITKADNLSPKVFKPALMQEKPKVAYTPEQKKSALRDF